MGTVEQAVMNADLHRMLVLFSVVIVPAGPRTPAAAARIALVWRFGGDIFFLKFKSVY